MFAQTARLRRLSRLLSIPSVVSVVAVCVAIMPVHAKQAGGKAPDVAFMLEVLSPTENVRFDDYLTQAYKEIKRHWMAGMPGQVLLGEKGVVVIRIQIRKDGALQGEKPTIEYSSGKKPLDEAAVAAIQSSAPFRPLPDAFRGPYMELRFKFFYNLRPDRTGPS